LGIAASKIEDGSTNVETCPPPEGFNQLAGRGHRRAFGRWSPVDFLQFRLAARFCGRTPKIGARISDIRI
jgi:hypothetical protein